MEADLVLAADGVRSRTRQKLFEHELSLVNPIVSNICAYGVQVSFSQLASSDVTRKLLDYKELTVWLGDGKFVVARAVQKDKSFSALFLIEEDLPSEGQKLWSEVSTFMRPRE